MNFSLVFNNISPWWILPCAALGLLYAWVLYRQDAPAGKALRRLLFTFRALAVAMLAFLLLSPLLKRISRTIEKPVIVIAQDNSSSILLDEKNRDWYTVQLPEQLSSLGNRLEEKFDVQFYQFSDHPERDLSPDFTGKQTDISLLVKELRTRFAGRNLGAVVLLTDGIYNKGSNPLYEMKGLNAPFYTVALGDTIPKKDLLIASVDHNQVVFLGNDFRISIHAEAIGAAGATSRIRVQHDGQTLYSETVPIKDDHFRISLPADLEATAKGRQKYIVSLEPVEGEVTDKNNTSTIFVEVLDRRRKILILGAAPHPDIGALKQALEKGQQYEVITRLGAETQDTLPLPTSSLVILHQLPSAGFPVPAALRAATQGTTIQGTTAQQAENSEKQPVWHIIGNQTDLASLGTGAGPIRITEFSGSYNDAFAIPDPSFYLFSISGEHLKRLGTLPPLTAPFCEITPREAAIPLFTQRIGQVATGRPLMLFSANDGTRAAWLFGEGLWRWRLHDFRLNGNHDAVDGLITKTVQYLSTREDTRRFRLSMPKEVFSENEEVTFTAELYNESYEAVTRPDVHMNITDEKGETYPFIFSKAGDRYHLNAGVLPPGDYTYEAIVQLGDEKNTATGTFVITPQHAEELETTANHQLLYNMAESSGGKMLYPHQTDSLYELLAEKKTIAPVIYEQERYRDLIHLKWIFFILLALLGTEWFLRKQNGLY